MRINNNGYSNLKNLIEISKQEQTFIGALLTYILVLENNIEEEFRA